MCTLLALAKSLDGAVRRLRMNMLLSRTTGSLGTKPRTISDNGMCTSCGRFACSCWKVASVQGARAAPTKHCLALEISPSCTLACAAAALSSLFLAPGFGERVRLSLASSSKSDHAPVARRGKNLVLSNQPRHLCLHLLLSLQHRLQLRLELIDGRHGWRSERCALYTLANEFYSRYHVRLL